MNETVLNEGRPRIRRRSADCVYSCLNFVPRLEDIIIRAIFKKWPPFWSPWRTIDFNCISDVYAPISTATNGVLNQLVLGNLESPMQALKFVKGSQVFSTADLTNRVIQHLETVESVLDLTEIEDKWSGW